MNTEEKINAEQKINVEQKINKLSENYTQARHVYGVALQEVEQANTELDHTLENPPILNKTQPENQAMVNEFVERIRNKALITRQANKIANHEQTVVLNNRRMLERYNNNSLEFPDID